MYHSQLHPLIGHLITPSYLGNLSQISPWQSLGQCGAKLSLPSMWMGSIKIPHANWVCSQNKTVLRVLWLLSVDKKGPPRGVIHRQVNVIWCNACNSWVMHVTKLLHALHKITLHAITIWNVLLHARPWLQLLDFPCISKWHQAFTCIAC